MHTLIRRLRTAGASAHTWTVSVLRRLTQRLRSAWSTHLTLIENNPAYAAALAAGAANIVRQISVERYLVALASAGLAIYLAIRGRGLACDQRLGGTRADDFDDDGDADLRLFRSPRWGDG
jgi:hypothetical protein